MLEGCLRASSPYLGQVVHLRAPLHLLHDKWTWPLNLNLFYLLNLWSIVIILRKSAPSGSIRKLFVLKVIYVSIAIVYILRNLGRLRKHAINNIGMLISAFSMGFDVTAIDNHTFKSFIIRFVVRDYFFFQASARDGYNNVSPVAFFKFLLLFEPGKRILNVGKRYDLEPCCDQIRDYILIMVVL